MKRSVIIVVMLYGSAVSAGPLYALGPNASELRPVQGARLAPHTQPGRPRLSTLPNASERRLVTGARLGPPLPKQDKNFDWGELWSLQGTFGCANSMWPGAFTALIPYTGVVGKGNGAPLLPNVPKFIDGHRFDGSANTRKILVEQPQGDISHRHNVLLVQTTNNIGEQPKAPAISSYALIDSRNSKAAAKIQLPGSTPDGILITAAFLFAIGTCLLGRNKATARLCKIACVSAGIYLTVLGLMLEYIIRIPPPLP